MVVSSFPHAEFDELPPCCFRAYLVDVGIPYRVMILFSSLACLFSGNFLRFFTRRVLPLFESPPVEGLQERLALKVVSLILLYPLTEELLPLFASPSSEDNIFLPPPRRLLYHREFFPLGRLQTFLPSSKPPPFISVNVSFSRLSFPSLIATTPYRQSRRSAFGFGA